MKTPRLMLLLVAVLLMASISSSPAHAQGDPSMLVSISDAAHTQTRILAIGDDRAGQELFNYSQADVDVNNVIISRDTQWVAMTLVNKSDATMSVWYQHTGSAPVTIPNAQVASFTNDSSYLLYYWALFQSFGVGIVNLSTGKNVEFVGAPSEDQALKKGAALPLHFDGSTLYVVGFLPFSDGAPFGLYSYDLAGSVADLATKAGRFDLPKSAAVVDVDAYSAGSAPALSPDGTKVAFLAVDSTNPPANYPDLPFTPPTNSVYVVNLATKTLTKLAQAGPGQVLFGLSWTGDSQGVMVAGGSFGSINTLYTASVEGNVQPLGSIGAGNIWSVSVCGRYVYFTWGAADSTDTFLYKRALLSDLTTVEDVGTPGTMRLLGCSA